MNIPTTQPFGCRLARWPSSVVLAGVTQRCLRRLCAATPLPVIKLIDALAVRTLFALQKNATDFAARDVVHSASRLFPNMQPIRLTPITRMPHTLSCFNAPLRRVVLLRNEL
jgi:hypothetical protein